MKYFKPAWLLYKYLQYMQFDIHKAMMHTKLKHYSPTINGRWLDIGAGDQPYKKYFSGANEYLTTNTKRHYNSVDFLNLEKRTTYWIEDGSSLPVPDNSLDGVACFQVLSVLGQPDKFFGEINRVMKPGGKLLLTTDFLYPVWSKEDRYRHTAFNLNQLSENNGFSDVTIESFGGFGSMMYAIYMRYMRSFPDLWKLKKIFAKTISLIPYLFLLMILPITSLIGIVIFLLEMSSTRQDDFTFNLLLSASKRTSL